MDWNPNPEADWLAGRLAPRLRGPGALNRRLADAIRDAVTAGELVPGARLPAERVLARALGVSRTTVVAANEALAAEGLLERRQGSGTRVTAEPLAAARMASATGLGRRMGEGLELVDLGPAAPLPPQSVFEAMRQAADAGPGRQHGYLPLGLPALREAVADLMTGWGLPTDGSQVMITNGAHQAISLVAGMHLRRGDPVVIEDPTYTGAVDILAELGARMIPVDVGRDGVDPDAVREAVNRSGARLLYVIPTGQNPTGTVMPERRRAELARVIADLQVPTLEDVAFHDLTLRGMRPPMLAGLAPRAPIIVAGSLSKLFWGGLRVGWIRGPADALERLGRLKLVADHGSSIVSQLVALHLLPGAEAQREASRRQLAERIRVVEERLPALLPDWSWRAPAGGLSLWVRLPVPEAEPFCRFARERGVLVVPGPVTSPVGGAADRIRVALVLPPDRLAAALERLADVWREYVPGRDRDPVALGALV